MEEGINKSRNPLSDRMMGSDNGAGRVIGFVDFMEGIERVLGLGYGGGKCIGKRDHGGDQRFEGK